MRQGPLFYLMGASGVGKDSLLGYLRSHQTADRPMAIPQRFITRPASAGGEPHIELSTPAFLERLQAGGFAMHWQSHGYHYGIGIEIDQFLDRGCPVVINGSRHYLETAQRLYSNLCPVLVTASHDQLLQRLLSRGRESAKAIEQRLQRAESLDNQLRDQSLIRLANEGPLEQAGQRLLEIILDSSAPSSHHPAAATG